MGVNFPGRLCAPWDTDIDNTRLLEFCPASFPSLPYNLGSYQQLITRRRLQSIALDLSENFKTLHVILAGDTGKRGHVQLISKKKARRIETDNIASYLQSKGNNPRQNIPIVYYIRDNESIHDAVKKSEQISSRISGTFKLHYIFVSHDATEDLETWQTYQGFDCVKVPYSKDKVRQVVSIIFEKPIFENLHRIKTCRSNLDMQTYMEVQTLLKHERYIRESNTAVQYSEQVVPIAVVDILKRRKEIKAFGIWQDKFLIFLKGLPFDDIQSKINSMLQKADDVFFSEMTPKYVYTASFNFTKCIRQGDALYNKNENVGICQGATASFKENQGTIGALLRNRFSKEKLYGLTSGHLFPMTNVPAFTKREGTLDPCGNCILSFRYPDMAFLEIDNIVRHMCVTAFHDETEKPRRTQVYHDSLAKVGKVHKKGASSNWTEGMIVSPDLYVDITEGGSLEECIVIEGISGRFSCPGDSGSVIFAHSPDHSHLQAVGIVFAGDLEIRYKTCIDRQEAKMNAMTFAFRLQQGFDKARKSEPSFNFEFEDVKSSSSESDED